MILETDVENYFKKRIEKRGAWCPKWESPGTRGVPDRLVFFPKGRTATVETKRPKGGVVSRSQKKIAEKLVKMGHVVFQCWTKEEADWIVNTFEEWGWFDHES